MTEETIAQINEVITAYFNEHPSVDWIPVKDIMPELIKAGIFKKDEKNGLPIRKVLRALDAKEALDVIPFVHAERIDKKTHWYLVKEGAKYEPKETINPIPKKLRTYLNRKNSDAYYILDLCDEILEEQASRQHTFDFLVGDFHQDGRTRTALPVDAYYQSMNLVIEYAEKQGVNTVDNPDKMTVSGVTRAEQRKLYNKRRREVLRKKEVNLIEIKYKDFECDADHKLVRQPERDLNTLKNILKKFLPKK